MPALVISEDRKILWASTGTEEPALYRIDGDSPAATRIQLPSWQVGTAVQRIAARGPKVFVWHADVQGKNVLTVRDTSTNSWQTGLPLAEDRSVTTTDADGYAYAVVAGQLQRLRPAETPVAFEAIGTVPGDAGVATARAGATIYHFGHGASQLWAHRQSTSGAAQAKVDYRVIAHNAGTSRLLTVD